MADGDALPEPRSPPQHYRHGRGASSLTLRSACPRLGNRGAAVVELRLLQIFCRVYEERSFSKAAASLGLAQPTVSEHVKKLEGVYETPLFERTTREVRPTRAGEQLYHLSRGLADIERQVAEGMSRFLGEGAGEVVVGASTIPGEVLLPRLVAEFRKTQPRVRVTMSVKATRAVLEDLAAGRADVAFVGAAADGDHFRSTRFASDRLVLVAPATGRWKGVRALTLDELCREPFLLRERGSGTREALEDRLTQAGLSIADLRIAAELGSTTAIKESVRQGAGVSIVSDLSVRQEIASGHLRVVPVRGLRDLRRDFYAVTDTRRPPSVPCELFLEHVRARAQPRGRGQANARGRDGR